jgi:methionyl-tRNA synthetase
MSRKFYVTTPIYYVNDSPHIGHAYTTIAADVLARYHRACGRDVRFLTGTDEHGIKIVKAAAERGLTPRQLADEVVVHFQDLWKDLNISNDDFIRTTQPRHEKRVQEIVRRLVAKGEIYSGQYEGWYDEGQEEFVTESVARENNYKSPISGKDLVRYSEPTWYFRLKKWVPRLREHILGHDGFILPPSRRNEVLSKLEAGVEDLSVSRLAAKLNHWGIAMPNDHQHVVYVWVDALSNYITALGHPAVGEADDDAWWGYWSESLHLIGKDILWFHTVYWPCILMAVEEPLPRCVFAHGWWTSEGKKMSKSLGNVVSREVIADLCREYSRDVFRYFLLREVPFGADGDFSREAFKTRHNNELANDVGNLLSRTVNMIGRYFGGRVPSPQASDGDNEPVLRAVQQLGRTAPATMAACQFQAYLGGVLEVASATNKFIETTAPFKMARDPAQRQRLATVLYTCAEAVRVVLSHLAPFMPEKAVAGLAQLGLTGGEPVRLGENADFGRLVPGTVIGPAVPLFPRKA